MNMSVTVFARPNQLWIYIYIYVLNDSEQQQFLDHINKWNCCLDNHMFGLITYSSIYCKMDCKVLMYGYGDFRGWILEHTELTIYHYITFQSLASALMLKSGCYNNLFQISGVWQPYSSRCVVGGRCMTAEHKMYHDKKKVADFGVCSLYPSATYVFHGCFLEGLPILLLNNTSYYF